MKISEIIREIQNSTKRYGRLFVDMDGVIADFDVGMRVPELRNNVIASALQQHPDNINRMLGKKFLRGIDDPAQRENYAQQIASNTGVIVNLIRNAPESSKNKIFSKLLTLSDPVYVTEFFENLPFMTEGRKLIEALVNAKIPFTILSAPLDPPATLACKQAKIKWLQTHIDPLQSGSSRTVLFSDTKFEYAKSGRLPNILIDDREHYLEPWRKAGGIGIQHTTWNNTYKQLQSLGILQ